MQWRDVFLVKSLGNAVFFATIDNDTREVCSISPDGGAVVAAALYFDKRKAFLDGSPEAVKQEWEKWQPRRREMLNKYAAGTLEAMKMEAFYDALDAGYAGHRAAIRGLLAAEREAGAPQFSQTIAQQAAVEEGGGYRGKARQPAS